MRHLPTPVLTPFGSAYSTWNQNDIREYPIERSDYFDLAYGNPSEKNPNLDDTPLDSLVPSYTSPIHSTPVEILTLIFESGFLDGEGIDEDFRTVVAKVSRRWREITLHTPALWSVYYLSQANIHRLLDALPLYLKRSGDYPLEIHLSCFWDTSLTEEIIGHFLPHAGHWKTLSIITPNSNILQYIEGVSAPKLRIFKLSYFSPRGTLFLEPSLFQGGRLPSLRSLSLRNVSFARTTLPLNALHSLEIRGYGTWPQYCELNRLIGGSTSLRELKLHVHPSTVHADLGIQDHDLPIFLPTLRTLDVITSEWLTSHIARLTKLFACPAADVVTIRDDISNFDIMGYRQVQPQLHSPHHVLRVSSGNLYLAFKGLNATRSITTLELDNAIWPFWSDFTTVLSALPSLRNLVVRNFYPVNALTEIGNPLQPLKMPFLEMMDITVIKRQWDVTESSLASFIGLFDLQNLRTLLLRNISAGQWKHLVHEFRQRVDGYPRLESLTLSCLHDIVDMELDPSSAFPHLRKLNLHHVNVNPILRFFLPNPSLAPHTEADGVPWSKISHLTIHQDSLVSRPLLHQIISTRNKASRPLTLGLDSHFERNVESWEWLKENARVIFSPTVDYPCQGREQRFQ